MHRIYVCTEKDQLQYNDDICLTNAEMAYYLGIVYAISQSKRDIIYYLKLIFEMLCELILKLWMLSKVIIYRILYMHLFLVILHRLISQFGAGCRCFTTQKMWVFCITFTHITIIKNLSINHCNDFHIYVWTVKHAMLSVLLIFIS